MYIGETIVMPSGDIYMMGAMDRADSSVDDSFLLKLSGDGSFQWLKTYGFATSTSIYIYQFDKTGDGFVGVGTVSTSVYTIKINLEGELVGQSKYL